MPDPPTNTTSGSSPPSSSPISNPEAVAGTVAAYTRPASPPLAFTPIVHSHPEREPTPLLSQPSQPTPSASRSVPPITTSRPRNRSIMDGLFRFSLPQLPSSQAIRTAGVYISGALFSLGFWFFIDASVYSKVNNPGDVHIKFVDWIPGICSASGMLVINSIEKSRLNADSFSYSGGPSVAWKARLVLFLGFALMAGGLAGSVAVLVLKYIVEQYEFETMYFGIANVVANSLVMLSSAVLWVSQNMEDDYAYHLSL